MKNRKEGPAKLLGQAKYIDDMNFPQMLHGVTVRSPVPRGILKGIKFEGDVKGSGCLQGAYCCFLRT